MLPNLLIVISVKGKHPIERESVDEYFRLHGKMTGILHVNLDSCTEENVGEMLASKDISSGSQAFTVGAILTNSAAVAKGCQALGFEVEFRGKWKPPVFSGALSGCNPLALEGEADLTVLVEQPQLLIKRGYSS